MATRAPTPQNVDELFRFVVWAMAILTGGVVLLGIGSFTGVTAANLFGYGLIGVSFMLLLLASQPVWN